MKRAYILAALVAVAAMACSDSTSSPSGSETVRFTAVLLPANEVPAVVGPETSGSGNAVSTFVITKDSAGAITGATVTMTFNLTGFPAGTPINIAHIHEQVAGVAGPIRINTNLLPGEFSLANGSGSITRTTPTTDAALIQRILDNPAGFYFNAHSTTNPGGVARGQLVKSSLGFGN